MEAEKRPESLMMGIKFYVILLIIVALLIFVGSLLHVHEQTLFVSMAAEIYLLSLSFLLFYDLIKACYYKKYEMERR